MPSPYYQDDTCTIYHGDSSDLLPQLPRCDLVLTDPPYGLGIGLARSRRGGERKNPRTQKRDYGEDLTWDNERVSPSLLALTVAAADNAIIFGGNYYADLLPASDCWLVWDKVNGTSAFADCELAWTNLPGAVRRLHWMWDGYRQKIREARYHPAQKPQYLMRWCIDRAEEKMKKTISTVIDPYMGVGTTLRAAKDLGKISIGIEREEKYCEIAVKRLAQEALFQQDSGCKTVNI